MTLPFSVVIPTYNRAVSLRACLDSLAAQEYPRDRFEVVIVDDGGASPAAEIAAGFRDRLAVSVHRQTRGGPAAARNTGANLARGTCIAFIDDDCLAVPRWLAAFDAAFQAHGERCVLGGWTLNPYPDRILPGVSDLILRVIREQYRPEPGGIYFFGGANLAVPAEEFRRAGGFDASFVTAEDREFCDRWLHHGGALVDVPEATVSHADNLTYGQFLLRYVNYGRGAYRFHRLRRLRGSGGPRADFALFYLYVLRACFAGRHPVLNTAAWGTWQVANATGFAWEFLRQHLGGADPLGRA